MDGQPAVDVAWVVQEGDPAYINRVAIVGNTVTHEQVIRDRIVMLPGDVYSEDRLIQSYRSISSLGFFQTPYVSWRPDIALWLGPRQSGLSALDVDDMTEVEIRSHRLMEGHCRFFRENAPGFENAYSLQSASQLGVRHTRRLAGVERVEHPVVRPHEYERAALLVVLAAAASLCVSACHRDPETRRTRHVQRADGGGLERGEVREQGDAYFAALRAHFEELGLERGSPEARAAREAFDAEYWQDKEKLFADVTDVADHIDHVVELVGVDHVGIGSDFDGVGGALADGLRSVADFPNLVAGLQSRGYDEDAIRKILGGNLLRVWRAVEAGAAGPR